MATNEELLAQIRQLQAQLHSLSKNVHNNCNGFDVDSDLLESQGGRIERYLSDFTNREGVLLTIAGIFSVLPIIGGKEYLLYFLAWIYPFLILGIVAYIFSTKRINIISKIHKDYQSIEFYEILKKNYLKVVKFHNLTDILLVAFFAFFIFNYYFMSFIGLPEIETSILITVLSVLCGIFRYLYISRINKNDKTSNIEMMPVGSVPADALNSPDEKETDKKIKNEIKKK